MIIGLLILLLGLCDARRLTESPHRVNDTLYTHHFLAFGSGRNFSLRVKHDNRLIGHLENGNGCVLTGFDENAHIRSHVLLNTCLNQTWGVVIRAKNEYVIYDNGTVEETNHTLDRGCNETLPELGSNLTSDAMVDMGDAEITAPAQKRKFVRVNLITDKPFAVMKNYDQAAMDKSVLNIASYIAFIYRNMPGYYNVTVQIASVKHLKTESSSWDGLTGASTILQQFAYWAHPNRKVANEAVHLLTGIELDGGVVGIARIRGYCTGLGYGLTQANLGDVYAGKIAAHEIGHNLGFQHTTIYQSGTAMATPESVEGCIKIPQALMSPYISGSSVIWDDCSVNWFRMQQEGFPFKCSGGACTYTPSPTQCYESTMKNLCGNDIIEEGEECDSDSKCCKDCKLVRDCDPTRDPCCNQYCTYMRKGRVCHRRDHVFCDSKSRCTGTSAKCPLSKAVHEGEVCSVGQKSGICRNRDCRSHDILCAEMAKLFPSKKIKGSCPRANIGDISCGKLYCEREDLFCDSFTVNNEIVYVPDGTPCNTNAYCKDRKCVTIPSK